MFCTVKKTIRSIIMIAVMLMLCYCSTSQQSGEVNGKTTSGCYIIKVDNYYYFANPKDGNRLSRMDQSLDNIIRLSDYENMTPFIQIDKKGDCLYYIQTDSQSNEKGYRGQLCCYNISTGKEDILFQENVMCYSIIGEWVYCSTINPAQMYRINIQNATVEKVGKEHTDAFVVRELNNQDDFLIYVCHEAINKTDTISGETESIPGYSLGMIVYNSSIYNINSNRGNIVEQYDIKEMKEGVKTILVDDPVYSFTVLGQNISYSSLEDEVYLLLENGHKQFIDFGRNPLLTQDYLFYFDMDGNLCSSSL